MGGATLGHALAKAGRRVLFCEKGSSCLDKASAKLGNYAETFSMHHGVPRPSDRATLEAAGRWWDDIHDTSTAKTRSFVPFIGAGAGGSSALYGAALERFFPSDFAPANNFTGGHGAELAKCWPIAFEDLLPYYQAAEALYRVRGGGDPLKGEAGPTYAQAGAELQPDSQELMSFFAQKGLHPYQLPLACEQIPGCTGCQGYLCPNNCKNDSAKICLATAITEYGAVLWDSCEVLSLDAGPDRVRRARCLRNGVPVDIEADLFVLAAGALATPALLLRSRSDQWPNGVANGSGLVGKYLMRHYVDLYAIFAKSSRLGNGLKQVAFNDLYFSNGRKFGAVQSFGSLPPGQMLVDTIKDDLQHDLFETAGLAIDLVRPVLSRFLGGLFGRATLLASIMEDLPYRDNQVTVGAQGEIRIHYQVSAYELARIKAYRKELKALFSPYKTMLIAQAENNHRIAHACGTCRFGDDPGSSVLNRYNRAHELDNLYVADASFFPSSGGTNPALTIAANALRVADQIISGVRQK